MIQVDIFDDFEKNIDLINEELGMIYPKNCSSSQMKERALYEYQTRYPNFKECQKPKIKFRKNDEDIITIFKNRECYRINQIVKFYEIPVDDWENNDQLIDKIIEHQKYLFNLNLDVKKSKCNEVFNKIDFEKQTFYNEYKVIPSIINNCNIPNHPSKAMETQTLYNIELPQLSKEILNLIETRNWTGLSKLQVETVLYILSCHKQKLSDQTRRGYLIADSTGLGKTREILGVISYNYDKGRKKCLWVSASSSLYVNTKSELDQIYTKEPIKLFTLDDKNFASYKSGILFTTYKKMISNGNKKSEQNRFDEICSWLGEDFDGVIIFDECHFAKGFDLRYKSSKTGLYVFELQKKYKNARIIYSSASFASEIKHLAYMNRLGVWNRYFDDNFNTFKKCIETGGVGAIELLSCELKKNGSFCSRNLSYEDVKFDIHDVILSSEQEKIYEQYAKIWKDILDLIRDKKVNTKYWSAHQRFFLHLILSFKIEKCIEIANEAINNGESVVIGLFSTGESSMKRCKDDQFSTLKEIILNFISSVPNNQNIISSIKELNFPDNPMDELINRLGGHNKVAEISGRTSLLIKTKSGYKIESRDSDESNLVEMDNFQNGVKDIAIITEAASIGISLHATEKSKRRVHIILQLPWSAEKALQQLGRTHRSNQVYTPHYKIIFTDLAGEKRLISTIATRLSTLGAICNGDRRSSGNAHILSKHILCPEISKLVFSRLEHMYTKEYQLFKPQKEKVKSFLNKLLGIPPKLQTQIFNEFVRIYDSKVEERHKIKLKLNEVNAINEVPTKIKDIYNPVDDKSDSKILVYKHKGCAIIGNVLPFIEEIVQTLGSLKKFNHSIYDGIKIIFVYFEEKWNVGCLFPINLSNTLYQCIKMKVKRITKEKYDFISDSLYEYLIDFITTNEFGYEVIKKNAQKLNMFYHKFQVNMDKNIEELRNFYKTNHLGYIDDVRKERIQKSEKIEQIRKKIIRDILLNPEQEINEMYKKIEFEVKDYFQYYYQ